MLINFFFGRSLVVSILSVEAVIDILGIIMTFLLKTGTNNSKDTDDH